MATNNRSRPPRYDTTEATSCAFLIQDEGEALGPKQACGQPPLLSATGHSRDKPEPPRQEHRAVAAGASLE